MSSAEHYQRVCDQIAETAIKCGRHPADIGLVAVTKNVPWPDILPVYEVGCRRFGENRMQEALDKQLLSPEDVQWHFIGTLQKNKVRKAIGRFALIHSVDHPDLAKKISDASIEAGAATQILLEVNTSGERSKHGFSPEEWKRAFENVIHLKNLSIEGLMTMAPLTEDVSVIRSCFASLRDLKEKLRPFCPQPEKFLHLSMGMSHDFPIAIQEGATLLRIGSAIFKP